MTYKHATAFTDLLTVMYSCHWTSACPDERSGEVRLAFAICTVCVDAKIVIVRAAMLSR